MTDVLIRNLDDHTLEALKRRAARNRRSLQQELVAILEATIREEEQAASAREASEGIRTRLAERGGPYGDAAGLVREDRER